jgi:hypothetical protein
MESFKHSCPYCGQHIEYTAGYCGKQMRCPICGNTITFPAVPPRQGGPSLHIKSAKEKSPRKWSWQPTGPLRILWQFQHWNIVAQCAVPFLIIAALLAGAAYVRNKFTEEPPKPTEPIVQADPQAWEKMTDLAKTEQAVQNQIRVITKVGTDIASLTRQRAELQRSYQGVADPEVRRTGDEQIRRAEEELQRLRRLLNADRQRFDLLYSKYQSLGGNVDYRSQLPNY